MKKSNCKRNLRSLLPDPVCTFQYSAEMSDLDPCVKIGLEDEITKEAILDTDLKDGEMREIEVDGQKILLVKSKEEVSGLGARCTHYGAPLSKGVLSGQRIRCPWHGACFNTKTGDIEEYPGLDSLPCYKVKVENKHVFVTARKQVFESSKRLKEMTCRSTADGTTILILGGGPAALVCAESLRQEGYRGRVIIATKEKHLPYDRTKLSKAMNQKLEDILLRPREFFSLHDIEVWTEKEAVFVTTAERRVNFQDGTSQLYDQLLIATGSLPNKLTCPGSELENVLLLRTPEDASKIQELSAKRKVVIAGSSFIGMEVAAYLSDKASSASVVGNSEIPFQQTLGPKIGKAMMKVN
nr:PREDICTED: apoptosis-inducing factor 3-like isoform X1 [Latimeria chalumnae]|eukprot:XP_014339653.1 PREDICTED: apoptosis-inducing factor 3-like isoform X1 [Latimeria chalumnae]